jgi:membrane AbrB-like protein
VNAAAAFRITATLLAAWLAAQLCLWWHTPLPWMLGPLVVTALASALGLPTRSANGLRNTGQWVIGAALGLYFTPQVGALVLQLWWAVLLGVVWALAQGYAFGVWLQWRHREDLAQLSPRSLRATTYFASAIGGASEMTLLSERVGARTDLVAASHTLRLLMVVLTVPFAMQWAQSYWGLHVDETLRMVNRTAQWPGLLWLALACAAGGAVMLALRRANPWFMGALLASMGLTLMGFQGSAIPADLINAAQLVIGVSLGVKFRKDFLHTAPQWLLSVAIGTLAMMLASALLAWMLSWWTGLHVATLSLGTSPGGIAEMAITAKVLQLGVPVVTAFQVSRLVAVLLLVGPLFRLEERRISAA